MTLNIWIPKQGPPNGHCNVCGEDLWGTVGDMQRHMGACARRNIDAIRAASPSVKWADSVFDQGIWNPDAEAHLERVGKRMLAEGRLEMKPHERIRNE